MLSNNQVNDLRRAYDRKLGQFQQVSTRVQTLEQSLRLSKRLLKNTEEAQLVAQTVAQQTQQELEYRISDIVTMALDAVFEEAYEFKIEFVQRRNKTEAEIFFLRDGEKIDPMTASGGGAVDVAAFALRIALWNITRPRGRGTIVLDEPFRFLSRELQPKAGAMLKMLSERLKLQFIIVTHNQDLIEAADKVFEVKMKRRQSHVS